MRGEVEMIERIKSGIPGLDGIRDFGGETSRD